MILLPYFRMFPAVISDSSEKECTAKFERFDSVMEMYINYFLKAREGKIKTKRPNVIIRFFYRLAYSIEQRFVGVEYRVFPPENYRWSLYFEEHYSAIHNEVNNAFNHVDVESIPLGPDKISKFHSINIAQQGSVDSKEKELFPTISKLLENVSSLANAELSILAPGAETRLHKAGSRCFLRMH